MTKKSRITIYNRNGPSYVYLADLRMFLLNEVRNHSDPAAKEVLYNLSDKIEEWCERMGG